MARLNGPWSLFGNLFHKGTLMSFFISDAFAEGAAASQSGDMLTQLAFLGGIFALFYFLMVRPQVKRAKDHKKMIESLAKGDEVVTSGGVLGRVADLEEGFITVEVADNVRIKVQRHAVTALVPKGTIKAAS